MPAVLHALQISNDQMGVERSIRSLLRVNQKDGFDCPGCAWPEEDKRHIAEFCENGAKAVAEEATIRRVGPGVLRRSTRSPSSRRTTTGGSASRAG